MVVTSIILMQTCQLCDKQPIYVCSDCMTARYCSNQHRNQHWRTHKQHCKVIKHNRQLQQQQLVMKQRNQIRKRYFQHFNHKIYDQCLVIAKELFALEKKHIQVTREIFNQFEYGIAVCLLCRVYLIIQRQLQAKQEIEHYLREKIHFLEDLRNLPTVVEMEDYSSRARQFFEKKLALISAVANIHHELKQNCIPLYQVYASHIQLVFGKDSLELSNVYFCIGGYYRQAHQVTKAIACFVKAAAMRGRRGGGDCYVNISLLYRRQGRIPAAIDMMLTAIKLNQDQFGSNSRQVGFVYQKLGLLYTDISDFNNAVVNLQHALKIYVNQKEIQDYQRIRGKIQEVHDRIKKAVEEDDMRDKQYQQNREIQSIQIKKQESRPMDLDKFFKVNQSFMQKMSSMELYRLSQLQLQLERSRSQYAVAFTVGNSQFFKKLSDVRRKELQAENEKLFQMIKFEKKWTGQNEQS